MTVTDEQLAADVEVLNAARCHIVMARDEHGVPYPVTRETLHALAEVVRCFHRTKQEPRSAHT